MLCCFSSKERSSNNYETETLNETSANLADSHRVSPTAAERAVNAGNSQKSFTLLDAHDSDDDKKSPNHATVNIDQTRLDFSATLEGGVGTNERSTAQASNNPTVPDLSIKEVDSLPTKTASGSSFGRRKPQLQIIGVDELGDNYNGTPLAEEAPQKMAPKRPPPMIETRNSVTGVVAKGSSDKSGESPDGTSVKAKGQGKVTNISLETGDNGSDNGSKNSVPRGSQKTTSAGQKNASERGQRKASMIAREDPSAWNDLNVLTSKKYDYYIFDFDNCISSVLLGVRSDQSADCNADPSAPTVKSRSRGPNKSIEETNIKDFGGQERVNMLQEFLETLIVQKRKFWILSRGRESRIKVALKNVGLLKYFEGALEHSQLTLGGASSKPQQPIPNLIEGLKSPGPSRRISEGQFDLAPAEMPTSAFGTAEHSLASPKTGHEPREVGEGADKLDMSLSNTNPTEVSSLDWHSPLNSTFDITYVKSRILASDTRHKPHGMYKGDQIASLLESEVGELPDRSQILFLDDNLGNLELAEDVCTVFCPTAGPHGSGLNQVEIRCLLNALLEDGAADT